MDKTEKRAEEKQDVVEPSYTVDGGAIVLSGDLTRGTIAALWPLPGLPVAVDGVVALNAVGVRECDSAGLAWLVLLNGKAERAGARLDVQGLDPDKMALFDNMLANRVRPSKHEKDTALFIRIGKAAVAVWLELLEVLSFSGEALVGVLYALAHPKSVRWGDWARVMVSAGVDAIPVVSLVGFLLGLILAFQSAMPLKLFGAEVYVASLIGIAVVRELGSLVAAIMMAGRTSSAFAAEIGTMTVNEEVSALRTMGVEPVRFLAVPRILATMICLPALSLFATLAGLAGGCVVLMTMGYSFSAYHNYAMMFVDPGDFYGSLFKSLVYGVLVASVGCLRGLQAGSDADAVGKSPTRAVVGAIVAVAAADGVMALVFYAMGI